MDRPPSSHPAPAPPPPPVRITVTDVLCVGPIVVHTVLFYVTLFLVPSLIGTNPLLLSALRGSTSSMIASGGSAHSGQISLLAALLAPVPILMGIDPFLYWAGRRYGRRIISRFTGSTPRQRRRIARGERLFARWGVLMVLFAYYIPAPSVLFYVAAGETRMPFWLFLAADFVGTMAWVAMSVGLGWALGQRATDAAAGVSHYALILTAALVVLFVVVATRRALAEDRTSPTGEDPAVTGE